MGPDCEGNSLTLVYVVVGVCSLTVSGSDVKTAVSCRLLNCRRNVKNVN